MCVRGDDDHVSLVTERERERESALQLSVCQPCVEAMLAEGLASFGNLWRFYT